MIRTMKKILATSLILFSAAIPQAFAQQNEDTQAPVVVELFTSQNCAACPPADAILEGLAGKSNIIALGCHVSYWDQNEWKDPLAQDFCDVRQHGYIGQSGEKRIYTPQMIVNGIEAFVGSHADELQAALENAEKTPPAFINITPNENDTVHFNLPILQKSGNYRLWAFGYKKSSSQKPDNGENAGRNISYANAAIAFVNLGKWSGETAEKTFSIPLKDIDGIIILAQEGGYGKIVAAGKSEF